MEFEYIREYYKVPAEYGREVCINGRKGVIVEGRGNYIGVNFHDAKAGQSLPYHPTHNVEYFGIVKPRKISRSQKRYREYIEADTMMTYKEWISRDNKHNRFY